MIISNLSPLRLPRMLYQESLKLRWCSFSESGRELISYCFQSSYCQYVQKGHRCTNIYLLRLAVEYLNVTINRNAEMQIQRLELTGQADPGKTRGLMYTGSGLVHQEAVGLPWRKIWNWTELFFQSKPEPVVGYQDPLLILVYTAFRNIHFLLQCPPSTCVTSIVFLVSSVLTNSCAGCLLVFRLQKSTPSERRYFVASSGTYCISFGVSPSSGVRFPRNLPISIHLPVYCSGSLDLTMGLNALSSLFCSGPHSTRTSRLLHSNVTTWSTWCAHSTVLSPWGCRDRSWRPPFGLPGW